MRVSTVEALRLAPWLLNASPRGARGNAVHTSAVVAMFLCLELAREDVGILGYTVPKLERPAVFAVWIPLALGFFVRNGWAQFRSVPAVRVLPALFEKTRRVSVVSLAMCAVLGAAAAGLFGAGVIAGASSAVFAYGFGLASHSRRTDSPRILWFAGASVLAANSGRVLQVAGDHAWLAMAMIALGLAGQFMVFRHRAPSAEDGYENPGYPYGVTPRGALPSPAALRTPAGRLKQAKKYLWRCRGPRFPLRVLIVACSMLVMAGLVSNGLIWLISGAELPEGGFMAGVTESLWGRPDAGDRTSRYMRGVSTLYLPWMILLPLGLLSQNADSGYLPFSRAVRGRSAFVGYVKTCALSVALVTGLGLIGAGISLWASGLPWPGTVPGFLLVLPYLVVAMPWAGVIALTASQQFPFHTGSMWKVFGKHGAILAWSVAMGLMGMVLSTGCVIELRGGGGWVARPWAWFVGPVLLVAGLLILRAAFDRFYARIPLVPEA